MRYFFNDVEVSKVKYDELCNGVGEVPVATPRVVAPVVTPKVAKREVTNVVKAKKGTKISQVVEMISANKNADKALTIVNIMNMLDVTKGNATIYYNKAMAILA